MSKIDQATLPFHYRLILVAALIDASAMIVQAPRGEGDAVRHGANEERVWRGKGTARK